MSKADAIHGLHLFSLLPQFTVGIRGHLHLLCSRPQSTFAILHSFLRVSRAPNQFMSTSAATLAILCPLDIGAGIRSQPFRCEYTEIRTASH